MKHRFEVLDIFRGIAATFVLFLHISVFSDSLLFNNEFVRNSDVFVDFFFVLSGFVIAYSLSNIENLRQLNIFIKKRFWRLYPLHVFMLFVYLFVELAKIFMSSTIQFNDSGSNNNFWTFMSSLLMLNSTLVFNPTNVSWNFLSWSISAEMISYLFFGTIGFTLAKLNIVKYRIAVSVLIVCTAYSVMRLFAGDWSLIHTYDYGFLRGIVGFFCGVISIDFFKNIYAWCNRGGDALFTILEFSILILIGVVVVFGADLKPIGFVYDLIFVFCILIFAFERGFVSARLKRVSILKSIGKYSYSIYMTHGFLLSIFDIFFIRILKFSPTDYSYLIFPIYGSIFLISRWTYLNIEMRFRHKFEAKLVPDIPRK